MSSLSILPTEAWDYLIVFAFLALVLSLYWLFIHFFISRRCPHWLRTVHKVTGIFAILGTTIIFLLQIVAWALERVGLIQSDGGPNLVAVIAATIWVFLFFGLSYRIEAREIAQMEK